MRNFQTWSQCKCNSQHRTYNKWARCVFPYSPWVSGEGKWALIGCAWTVTLHDSLTSADDGKRVIDSSACGSRCVRRHFIIQIIR